MPMPMDRERRLSRFTAKLLRRSSSSSANFVAPNSSNPNSNTTSTSPSVTTANIIAARNSSNSSSTTSVNLNKPNAHTAAHTTTHTASHTGSITPHPSARIPEDDQLQQLQLQPQPPHRASSSNPPFEPSLGSSFKSPTNDSSNLLSQLTPRRLQSGDETRTLSIRSTTLQHQNQDPNLAHDPLRQSTLDKENDEVADEHVDQFPAVSFPVSAAVDADHEAGSSDHSSSSSSRALDPKEDRIPFRALEEFSLSRSSSAKGKSSIFRSSRHHLPLSSAASSPSLNVVDESRQQHNTSVSSATSSKTTTTVKLVSRPSIAVRRQSLVPSSQQRLISTLLEPSSSGGGEYFSGGLPAIHREMINRKIWVRRPNSSPTLVTVTEDDLVDDLRDVILKKYSNSLGRTFDSPDIIIKLVPRELTSRPSSQERVLGPEEPVGRTLDTFYPGGQTVDEALIIDVSQRRTPKPSPRQHNIGCHLDELRPAEFGDYFPPMPMIPASNPSGSASNASIPSSHHGPVPSMSVITTGQLPPLPSPGSHTSWHAHQHQHRPKYGRQHTPPPPIISTSTNASVTDGTVPPINVLIVEDNIINLKLLEAFMKRLKVRWATAMNGREAVNKWRAGGFHLVLMDIQLPIMGGLEATKEIRRYERLNNIGVFPRTVSGQSLKGSSVSGRNLPGKAGNNNDHLLEPLRPEDKLENPEAFKSPVIIVALTASSLQSDRNEALAAGCNDFLTKPVNIVWLEQKVTEWGCMQALIDFEGWRKWRRFDEQQNPHHAPVATTTTSTTTTTPELANAGKPETVVPQQRKSQPNIATSGNGKVIASPSTSNNSNNNGNGNGNSNDVAGVARGGGGSLVSSKSLPASGEGIGCNSSLGSSSSMIAPNGSALLEASGSPSVRSVSGSSNVSASAGAKKGNRSRAGSTPRSPKI
ncbi:hypothetical protein PAAG_11788 [Paracoccidioides lutzii Pb01]|uniref:Response regulatory domain-containing protein n=1 Tax=Paracoccidioides lutzii (strain ATCC MYA-826 / Pb01) TaxID=502779 RepID=A0A0A2V0U5_PARBA|nr:hypothetical protein PAAG_11788 [Paracoccidioides lutzii Pb01]KGQ01441.1 hypothetical protein PAAG_11788 [Paracoccidioides lutzii Pb01]